MKAFTIICFLFLSISGFTQIGINTQNPDASAALDISSNNKGLLIPRVETNSIANPAVGLMIFQPSDNGFYFYNGSNWQQLGVVNSELSEITDTDEDTKIQVEKFADEDIIRMDIKGQEKVKITDSWSVVQGRFGFNASYSNIGL